ncbi:hypothetical protein BDM02DRAFT_3106051 [Thelephora ganbajun]|uniref:Uncharacterized protein n=1 Tax=Thelephora ganbajun TaxID=370292 RepID=A0ACB6YXE3_THEGA|nr:hypothetical protein BDM02DRAFT_3106051 [Thelephora ganbajun]
MKNVVTEQEANTFNPELGPCCDPVHFRVHLEGTTCNVWNKSAIGIFVNRFLTTHPEYPSEQESVQEMVRMKSQATLDSMIRWYRKSNTPRTKEEKDESWLEKNHKERKRKLYHRRCDIMFLYPSLTSQHDLLEQLTPAGMSSDKEQTVGHHKQYHVIEPAWRSDVMTAWLWIFDALYSHARRDKVCGNQRGSDPRMRISDVERSMSRKFVPELPRNAYDNIWFNSQIYAKDTVRPGPPVQYFHNAKTLE